MSKRRFKVVPFLVCLAIPLVSGIIIGLLTRDSTDIYKALEKPPFSPPSIVFPIVWTILYALMGVSLYLVYREEGTVIDYSLFFVQLALNLLWPLLFFNAQAFTAAFVCLTLLWILILLMIFSFRKTSHAAAYLQIPYLLWVTFAGVLNLYIAIAN